MSTTFRSRRSGGPAGRARRVPIVALLAVGALAGCGTQVAGAGEPPVLHIGTGTAAFAGAGVAGMAADAAGTSGRSTTDPYPLHGTLPSGPGSAPVQRYPDTEVPRDRVAALAVSLGIDAEPQRHAHGWAVGTGPAQLVVRDGSGEWAYSRTQDQCPSYSLDIDSPGGAGGGVACAVSVAPDGVAVASGTPAAPDAPCASVAPQPGVVTCSSSPAAPVAPPSPPAAGGDQGVSSGSTGSGGSGGGSIATPGTPPGQEPAPGPKPVVTPVPDDAARAAAAPVLAAAGLDIADAVLGPRSATRDVSVDPVVAGLPTYGIATRVTVDARGVLAATGRLGEPVEGPAYPLVPAATALETLRLLPRPDIAMACLQGTDCTPRTPAVTGARLGLVPRWDAEGSTATELLVPAWLFDLEGGGDPVPVVAVAPRFLGEPDPGPVASASAGSPGTDGGSGSDPGTPAGPPASDLPLPVQPSGPAGSPRAVAVSAATVGADGTTLVLHSVGGVCETYTASAKETPDVVTVQLLATPDTDTSRACPALAKEVSATVTLAAPWAHRAVIDATTGQKVPVD
ncbi:MAG: hypothetical protein GC157_09280 [Frankiales bacterium]|nr:hypothetical protein [Frankiales bacterium]